MRSRTETTGHTVHPGPETPWDVAVVGAGPGGALVARELARFGASVLLLERSGWPRWKVCGSCLGPAARAVLQAVGLGDLPGRGGAVALREVVLHHAGCRAPLPLEGWSAWSRGALDTALVEAGQASGVAFRAGAHARLGSLRGERRELLVRRSRRRERVAASVVVDATGLGGLVEPSGPPKARVRSDARIGLGAIFAEESPGASAVPRGSLRMAVSEEGYVGLVRLEDGTLCAAAAVDPDGLGDGGPRGRVEGILEEAGLAPLGAPLRGWRGTRPLTWTPERATASRLFRLGDAAGYVEPFTGEGIGWALEAAVRLAPLVVRALEEGWDAGHAAAWEGYRRGAAERSRRTCRILARVLRRPLLVGAGVSAISAFPALALPVMRRIARKTGT